MCVCIQRRAKRTKEKRKIFFFLWRERRRDEKTSKMAAKNEKNSKILLFLLFFCALDGRHLQILGHLHAHRYSIHFFSLKISLCFVRWFYIHSAHKNTRNRREREREREVWEGERNLLAFFFIFFFCCCAFVVSFGRRKRARHFEFSFVRSLFPHCIIIISRRDERTTVLLTTTTREKERKNKRDLRVWARVFCRFLLPRITFIIDRRRRRNI